MDYSIKADTGNVSKDEKKRELTNEDRDLLLKGIRPKWMDQAEYKRIRKGMQAMLKHYRKGKLIYKAVEINEEPLQHTDENGNTIVKGSHLVRRTYPPYVKPKVGTIDVESQDVSK